MKHKIIFKFILIITISVSLFGCDSSKESIEYNIKSSDSSLESIINQTNNTKEDSSLLENTANEDLEIIDISDLNPLMAYSQLVNMLNNVDNYMGKQIKMKGFFSQYHDLVTGNVYNAVVIDDSTGCCSLGLEFRLSEDSPYTIDDLETGDTITVQGTLGKYSENGADYFELQDANITSVEKSEESNAYSAQ